MQILLNNPPRSRRRKSRRSSKKRRRVARRTARRYSAAPVTRTRKRRRRRNPFATFLKRRRRRRRATFSGAPTVGRKKHRRKSRRRSGGFSRKMGGYVYIPSKSELKDAGVAALTVLGLDKAVGYVIPDGWKAKLAQNKYGNVAASVGVGLAAAGVTSTVLKNRQLGSMIALGACIKGVVDAVLVYQGKAPTNFSGLVDNYPGMNGYVDAGLNGFVDPAVSTFNE